MRAKNPEVDSSEPLNRNTSRDANQALADMEQSFLTLLEAVGEDPARQGWMKTPARAAERYTASAITLRKRRMSSGFVR